MIGLAVDPAGARRLKKEGRLTAFIGMENGYPIGRDLSLIEFFYDKGVRYITLCHSSDNDICDSSTDRRDPEDKGLSDFGRQVVAECNRLGMIVDVSHASDKSFFDVLAASRAPVIASHSSARAVCDNPRNLTDDQLRALAKNGGVIQICFLGAYVKTPRRHPRAGAGHQGARSQVRQHPRPSRTRPLRAKAMAERDADQPEVPPGPGQRPGPRRPHRPRQEGRRHRLRRDRHRLRRRRRGRRLRRCQRHDPRYRGAHPPRLHRPGDREDLGRQFPPRLPEGHRPGGEIGPSPPGESVKEYLRYFSGYLPWGEAASLEALISLFGMNLALIGAGTRGCIFFRFFVIMMASPC